MANGNLDWGDEAPDTSPEGLRRFFEAVAVLQDPDPDPEHRFDFLGPRPSQSSESDEVLAYRNFMIGAQPSAALKMLTTLCSYEALSRVDPSPWMRLMSRLHWQMASVSLRAA